MLIALKLLGGAIGGAILGWLLSGVGTCSSEACKARPNRLLSIIAGIVLGLLAAWALIR